MQLLAVAKRNDPSTSWDAGEEFHATGRAARHRAIILAAVTNYGRTSAEIAKRCPELDRHQVARRLREIEKGGDITCGEKRVCDVTGKVSVTWRFNQFDFAA